LDLLEYRLPAFDDRVVFSVIPFGFSLSNVLTANSPYFDTGRGSISRLGSQPHLQVYWMLAGDWLLSERVRLQVAYGTGAEINQGITGSDRSVLGRSFTNAI